MRKILFLLLFAMAAQVYAGDSPIWNYEFKTPDNQYHKLKAFKGKEITILDFWATWCKPCIKAMPELNELYEEYANRGVELVGINVDSPRNIAKVFPFTKSMGIDYPVLLDPNQKLMSEFNIVALPSIIFLDEEANIIFKHTGYNPGDKSLIKRKLEKALNQ